MPVVALAPMPKFQFFDNSGLPLAFGKVYTYQTGTTTPLDTYTDNTGTSTNFNPVVLDASGRANIWIGPQAYTFSVATASGTVLYTIDGISAQNMPIQAAIHFAAQAAPSAGAGDYYLWADSTGLRLKMVNNGTTDTVVGQNTTDTLTNKTLTSPTITSPTITSPTITGSGTAALATVTTKSLNGVLNANEYAGADIGAKVNAAYAALAATGGTIYIPAGAYSFSTVISCATDAKPVIIQGAGDNATKLTFTGSSGTAITLDWGAGQKGFGGGLRDLTLLGSGGTAIGLMLGSANGAQAFLVRNVKIGNSGTAFATGVSLNHEFAMMGTFDNVAILYNTTGLTQKDNTMNNENIKFINGLIAANGTGVALLGLGDFYFYGTSFDDNSTVAISCPAGNSVITDFVSCHFENPGGGTAQYLTVAGNACIGINGGEMMDQVASGTQGQFISFSGAYLSWKGTYLNSAGRTVTQAANVTAGNAVQIHGLLNVNTANIPLEVNSSIAQRYLLIPMRIDVTYPAIKARYYQWDIEEALVKRVRAANGTALVAGDFALSAGWGTTPSVSAIAATDQGGRVTITSGGGTPTANPTVTLTFKDGTWTNAPAVTASRGDTQAPVDGQWRLTSVSATQAIWTFYSAGGTAPSTGTVYILDFTVMGR